MQLLLPCECAEQCAAVGMPVAQCLLRDDAHNPESDVTPMLQRMWARKLVHHPKLSPFPDEAQADYSGFGVPLEQCAALDHCSYQGQCQVRYGGESAILKPHLADAALHHCPPSHNGGEGCMRLPSSIWLRVAVCDVVWCVLRYLSSDWCKCLFGYDGHRCENRPEETCINKCSGRGECKGTFCHCQPGSWGIDCSLPLAADHNAAAPDAVRIYVYEFPPWLNTWCVRASMCPISAPWPRIMSLHRSMI